jgi:hypothetical protein
VFKITIMRCPTKNLDCPYVDTLWMIKEMECEECVNFPGNEEEEEEENESEPDNSLHEQVR